MKPVAFRRYTCDHCGTQADITTSFCLGTLNVDYQICESCMLDALAYLKEAIPPCVRDQLKLPGWELQTVQGVKNVFVDTRCPSRNGLPQVRRGEELIGFPDRYIRVGAYTLPVVSNRIPR